jgi:1,2-diacylglycerol 3-alpha-glucosyltransferase
MLQFGMAPAGGKWVPRIPACRGLESDLHCESGMNIVMFTNTYLPHVGGVARSVQQFAEAFRLRGHRVLIVAPEFAGMPSHETDVLRIPALQNFNGSDFSVPMPIPVSLRAKLQQFKPQIIHSHHPFLLGDTALRLSATLDIPVVFTHHTQYERYTHYVPGNSDLLKRFVIDLAVGYCNLCDAAIAPSQSIHDRLRLQGADVEIVDIPTGVDLRLFSQANGKRLRQQLGIPELDFVVGHVGRLAPEKGLEFLSAAVAQFVAEHPQAWFLVAGEGPSADTIRAAFNSCAPTRLRMLGVLERSELPDVYSAMNVFAFASQSETQGMVLTEAMAAGTPVVAVDAPGVREIIQDGINGRMLPREDLEEFKHALESIYSLSALKTDKMSENARSTAEQFSMPNMAQRVLTLYERLIDAGRHEPHKDDVWSIARRRIHEEWQIWANVAEAASRAILRR